MQDWNNHTVFYRFNPEPLITFDLAAYNRGFETTEKQRLARQAERMRERRAAERQRKKMGEIVEFLEQHTRRGHRPMTVEELITMLKQKQADAENGPTVFKTGLPSLGV